METTNQESNEVSNDNSLENSKPEEDPTSEQDTQELENEEMSDRSEDEVSLLSKPTIPPLPQQPQIFFRRLHQSAFIPQKQHINDAGFDLTAPYDVTIFPFQCNKIETGITVDLPKQTYGRLVERSSWALKGLTLGGGVIDQDYTGEVCYCIYQICQNFITFFLTDCVIIV